MPNPLLLASLLARAVPLHAAGAQWTNTQAPIVVGEPFPDLALPTLDGEIRSIKDYRGTKVVFHVFASW